MIFPKKIVLFVPFLLFILLMGYELERNNQQNDPSLYILSYHGLYAKQYSGY